MVLSCKKKHCDSTKSVHGAKNIIVFDLLMLDSLVVWFGSGVMSIAVDQECIVQCVQISEHEANVVSV